MSSAYYKMDLRDFVNEVRTNGLFVKTPTSCSRKMHIVYEDMREVFFAITRDSSKEKAHLRGSNYLVSETLNKISNIKTERDVYDVADFMDITFTYGSYYVKDAYNTMIGWTIPSRTMLSVIQQLQKESGKRICDYGSGKGLLTYLLRKIGCNVRSVDKYINTQCFSKLDVVLSCKGTYKIHPNDILLMSWGLYNSSMLERYVRNGGTCVVIIGEDEDGCIYPPYNFFENDPEWTVTLYEIPNFQGVYTKMSVSIKH